MPGFLSNIRQSIMGSGSSNSQADSADHGGHGHGGGGHQPHPHHHPGGGGYPDAGGHHHPPGVRRHASDGSSTAPMDGRRRHHHQPRPAPHLPHQPSQQGQFQGGGPGGGSVASPGSSQGPGAYPGGQQPPPVVPGGAQRVPPVPRRPDQGGGGHPPGQGPYRGGPDEAAGGGPGGGGYAPHGHPGGIGGPADYRPGSNPAARAGSPRRGGGPPPAPGGPPAPGMVRGGGGGPGGRTPQRQRGGVPPGGVPSSLPPPPGGLPSAPPGSSGGAPSGIASATASVHCLNPASEINARLDTQVEVRVYPCNNNASAAGQNPKKKFTQFTVKPEGVIIQGTNRHRSASNDLGSEYALHVGRKLQRYELSDTRACQLLVTTHNKSFWVVPAPEAFSRHSGTCRLLGDRKHPLAPHTLQVGDFLRVGSVGVVVIETHNGQENRVLSEEKIQKIMKDTTSSSGGFLDLGETDGENSDDSSREGPRMRENMLGEDPVCYMCFDEEDTEENPLITPCKCLGDTRYVHVNCLRKWHTAEADNQICFLSSVDATCSVCKSTFKSDFKLKDGRTMKLFKSSLEPPYVSLLVATKHEMAQRLFNTRFQLSFSTLLKPDGRNSTRPLLLGRSSGSDMVLDYRTVSARHASIRFKNGEFVFTDAGSSNGSYLYLRRPVELTPSQPVQFRLGRSMISMKVVNKWNRRLLRAVRRTGGGSSGSSLAGEGAGDDHSVGSNEDDVRVTDGGSGVTRSVPRRTRDSIMRSLPQPGTLSQGSPQHLDLLYALAYPKREKDHPSGGMPRKRSSGMSSTRAPSSGNAADLSRSPAAGPGQPPLVATTEPSSVARRAAAAEEEESKVEVEEPEPEDAETAIQQDETLVPVAPDEDGMAEGDNVVNLDSVVMNEVDDEDEEDDEDMEDHGGDGDTLMLAPTGITEMSGGH